MTLTHTAFHWAAFCGSFVNATLFTLQIVRLVRTKCTKGQSLGMFVGFLCLQIISATDLGFHGVWTIVAGMTASAIATSTVIVLIIWYRRKERQLEAEIAPGPQ